MSRKIISITTGDEDGIGLEVAAKALHFLGPQKNTQFFLWRSESVESRYIKLLDKKWTRVVVDSLDEALKVQGPYLIDIASTLSPATWVELSAKACLQKKIHALATGPLSKTSIKEAGYNDLGHTDILKRLSKASQVNMGFVGDKFNIVLATGHVPIAKVSKALNFDVLSKSLLNANELRKMLPSTQAKKAIGVLGLNPHAGESGLIGHEEEGLFPQLQVFARKHDIPIDGPLVPDAAFFESNWKKYSLYLTPYHDQGLIPFKMIHGQNSGVHLTLGIPFIRTSVDHGTAKDIFGKNVANPSSMIDAIRWAAKLARL